MTDIATRITESAALFHRVVWPSVRAEFGAGALHSVEDEANGALRLLDYEGIDYLFRPAGKGTYGIASRVSFTDFETITLTNTQRSNLLVATTNPAPGRQGPAVYVHAYLDSNGGDGPTLRHAFIASARDVAAALPFASLVQAAGGEFWSVPADRIPGCRRVPHPVVDPFGP